MKVLIVASQKGGAGKTTLAAHLAVAAESLLPKKVVILDGDPQGSLSAWWNSREQEYPALASSTLDELPEKIEQLREAGFELVIIDTPPAITNAITKMVKLADLVLIPTRPSPHDLRAVGSTVSIALDENKPFIFVVTQAKSNAKLTTQAMAALSEHGMVSSTIIHDRVEYASSMINGETVVEINKKGRSTEEITQLLNLVLERMNVITKKRNKKAI